MQPSKKLILHRETLALLDTEDASQVIGGRPRYFSELRGCSLGGGVCTATCPKSEGSGCC